MAGTAVGKRGYGQSEAVSERGGERMLALLTCSVLVYAAQVLVEIDVVGVVAEPDGSSKPWRRPARAWPASHGGRTYGRGRSW